MPHKMRRGRFVVTEVEAAAVHAVAAAGSCEELAPHCQYASAGIAPPSVQRKGRFKIITSCLAGCVTKVDAPKYADDQEQLLPYPMSSNGRGTPASSTPGSQQQHPFAPQSARRAAHAEDCSPFEYAPQAVVPLPVGGCLYIGSATGMGNSGTCNSPGVRQARADVALPADQAHALRNPLSRDSWGSCSSACSSSFSLSMSAAGGGSSSCCAGAGRSGASQAPSTPGSATSGRPRRRVRFSEPASSECDFSGVVSAPATPLHGGASVFACGASLAAAATRTYQRGRFSVQEAVLHQASLQQLAPAEPMDIVGPAGCQGRAPIRRTCSLPETGSLAMVPDRESLRSGSARHAHQRSAGAMETVWDTDESVDTMDCLDTAGVPGGDQACLASGMAVDQACMAGSPLAAAQSAPPGSASLAQEAAADDGFRCDGKPQRKQCTSYCRRGRFLVATTMCID